MYFVDYDIPMNEDSKLKELSLINFDNFSKEFVNSVKSKTISLQVYNKLGKEFN